MKIKRDMNAFANLVPIVLAVIITFAILFVGIYVTGQISSSLLDTYPEDKTLRTGSEGMQQNTSENRIWNISENQDSALDIIQIVIIITILAAAIGAIFLFTRFD